MARSFSPCAGNWHGREPFSTSCTPPATDNTFATAPSSSSPLRTFAFDATILDKRKAKDDLRRDPFYFYKLAWYLHFKYVASKIAGPNDELLVVASSLQIKRKRKSTKAGVHEAITEVVNQVSPTVTCHCAFSPAATDPCLQVADYLTWAIQRKYESEDTRSYDLIEHLIKSEFEPFKRATKLFY